MTQAKTKYKAKRIDYMPLLTKELRNKKLAERSQQMTQAKTKHEPEITFEQISQHKVGLENKE